MKMNMRLMAVLMTSLLPTLGLAQSSQLSALLQNGMPYGAAKNALIQQHWIPVPNQHIQDSSLYAQELFEQGMQEVADCISMELDACWFIYQKGKQKLRIKTVTRNLMLDSYQVQSPSSP